MFQHGQVILECRLRTQPAQGLAVPGIQRPVITQDGAGIRPGKPGQKAQQAGFAAAVVTAYMQDFAGTDPERQVGKQRARAFATREMLNGKHWTSKAVEVRIIAKAARV